MRRTYLAGLLPLLVCAGCAQTLQPQSFGDGTPEMQPLTFFSGHTHSHSIMETSGGEPEQLFENDGIGTVDTEGTLHLTQHFTYPDGKVQERDWIFHRTGDHTYEGTANDVAGTAHGEAYGNVFHLTFTLELSPGNSLKDVSLEEWMYLQPDGNAVNRVLVSKLGLTAAMVTEYFRHVPEDGHKP